MQFKVQKFHFGILKETYLNQRHQSKPVVSCGDSDFDVKERYVNLRKWRISGIIRRLG